MREFIIFDSSNIIIVFWAAFIPTLFYFFSTIIHEAIPRCFPGWARRYEIHEPKQDPGLRDYRKVAQLVIFNGVLFITLHVLASPLFIWRGIGIGLESLPAWYILLIQLIAFSLIFDTVFYWVHRLLHHRELFTHIHIVHHTYREAFPLIGSYVHPIEFIVAYFFPYFVAQMLLGSHLGVITAYGIIMAMHNVHDHCGHRYPFDPMILFTSNNAAIHDFHHLKVSCNYSGGVFLFWDRLCGTLNQQT